MVDYCKRNTFRSNPSGDGSQIRGARSDIIYAIRLAYSELLIRTALHENENMFNLVSNDPTFI